MGEIFSIRPDEAERRVFDLNKTLGECARYLDAETLEVLGQENIELKKAYTNLISLGEKFLVAVEDLNTAEGDAFTTALNAQKNAHTKAEEALNIFFDKAHKNGYLATFSVEGLERAKTMSYILYAVMSNASHTYKTMQKKRLSA